MNRFQALAGSRPPGRNLLLIFAYHAVIRSPLEVFDWCFLDVGAFHRQLHTIRRHFEVVPLSTAAGRLRDGSAHRPMAAITFDDGFQSIYQNAYPILQELGVPATVFPTTGLVGTDGTVWFCRINRALALTRKRTVHWDGLTFDLSDRGQKARALATIQHRLKRWPPVRFRHELGQIVSELGDDPQAPIEAGSPYRMLSKDAVEEMAASPWVEFGAHGHTHAILSLLSPAEQEEEIRASLLAIQQLTGRPGTLFAYPNGRRQDYDQETIRLLHEYGVQAAVTTMSGFNTERTSPMELGRYEYSARRGLILLPMQAWSARLRHAIRRGIS